MFDQGALERTGHCPYARLLGILTAWQARVFQRRSTPLAAERQSVKLISGVSGGNDARTRSAGAARRRSRPRERLLRRQACFTVRVETTEDGKNEIMGLERGTIELTIDRLSHVRTRSQRVRLARCEQRGCLSIFIIGPIVEQGRIDSTDTDEAAARSRESS